MLGWTPAVRRRKPVGRPPPGARRTRRRAPFATDPAEIGESGQHASQAPAMLLAADPKEKHDRDLIGLALLVDAVRSGSTMAPPEVTDLVGEEALSSPEESSFRAPSVMSKATVCGQRGSCRIVTETLICEAGTMPSLTTQPDGTLISPPGGAAASHPSAVPAPRPWRRGIVRVGEGQRTPPPPRCRAGDPARGGGC
jgi:hypothetical protein